MAKAEDIPITEEMLEAVAQAQLYREDAILALRKIITEKLSNSEMEKLHRRIIEDERLKDFKSDIVKIESAANFTDDNADTIMLYYNRLLKQAQFEKKYEVVLRILKEIRQLKAIENEQMKFEIKISVEKPKKEEVSNND